MLCTIFHLLKHWSHWRCWIVFLFEIMLRLFSFESDDTFKTFARNFQQQKSFLMFLIVTINNRLFKGNSWMFVAFVVWVVSLTYQTTNDRRPTFSQYLTKVLDMVAKYLRHLSKLKFERISLEFFSKQTEQTSLQSTSIRKIQKSRKKRMRHVKMYTHCFCGNSFRYLLHLHPRLHLFHYSALTR